MPGLIKYERKAMTMAQFCAVRDYIVRKKIHDDSLENNEENEEKKVEEMEEEKEVEVVEKPVLTAVSRAQELRKEKQEHLNDITEQLAELQKTLSSLKDKKHTLFEQLRNLLSTEKQNKRQAMEKDRQIHGFGQPFLNQVMMPAVPMNPNPFRGIAGVKRPKSPSPPLVQLYSSSRNNLHTAAYDITQPSPSLARHQIPPHNAFGEGQRSIFQPVNPRIQPTVDQSDKTLPGFHIQQNFPRDGRQIPSGPQINTMSSQSSHYTPQDRSFLDQRGDRNLPFNHNQNNALLSGTTTMVQQRPPNMNQNVFLQQNMVPGTVIHKGFPSQEMQRPQNQVKKGSQIVSSSRPPRFY